MGTIALDYGCMQDAESAARRAAYASQQYAHRIEGKVTRKIDSLQGGGTGNTSSSSYFASQKMRSLNEKNDRYNDFADKMRDAKNYARDKDKAVSVYIRKESDSFRKSHGMKVNAIVEWFTWLTTTIINKTEFGRWIAQKFKEAKAWLSDRARDFRSWYELDGGKYILNTVLAVVGTVLAVAFLVLVAWPTLVAAFAAIAASVVSGAAITGTMLWTAITAGTGFVTAVMSVVNAMTKIYSNTQAYLNNEEDPGWAKRYSGYSSFSEMLRKEMFSSGFANKISYIAANIYDVIGITAEIINIAGILKSCGNFILTIKEKGAFHIFDKVHFKSPNGKVTWGTFKYGLKHLFNNVKITREGIKPAGIQRIYSYLKKESYGNILKSIEKISDISTNILSKYEKITKDGVFRVTLDTVIDKAYAKIKILDISKLLINCQTNIMKTRDKIYISHV